MRQVSDWLKGFCEFAEPFNATPAYIEWGAIWQLTTAIGRSAGTRLRGQQLTPNMFILLIGGPGTGKSQAVSAIRQTFFPANPGRAVIPSSVTRAGLQDYMAENLVQRTGIGGEIEVSNECLALSEEMQGILPEHDIGHLTLYNELYDVRKIYKARTRTHGEIVLQAPYCSIITGAQPAFLSTTLPEQAWGMGFMSRSIMVFDVPRPRSDAFESSDVDYALQTKLIQDLKSISKLHGWFNWTDEAKALYKTWWVDRGGPPEPQAKRLKMGYNSRRDLHFFKVAMAYSLSRSNDLVVTKEDATRAISLLLKTEQRMNHIFTEMTATGAMVAVADIIDAVKMRTADGSTMPEADLINLLMQRFPSTQTAAIIENLIASKQIKPTVGGADHQKLKGFRQFTVGDKLSAL